MDELFKNAAGIIREARQSLLGIGALIVLAIAVVAVLLFRDVGDATTKIIIFSLLMLFFFMMTLGLAWVGPAPATAGAPTGRRPPRRLLGTLLIGGVAVLCF